MVLICVCHAHSKGFHGFYNITGQSPFLWITVEYCSKWTRIQCLWNSKSGRTELQKSGFVISWPWTWVGLREKYPNIHLKRKVQHFMEALYFVCIWYSYLSRRCGFRFGWSWLGDWLDRGFHQRLHFGGIIVMHEHCFMLRHMTTSTVVPKLTHPLGIFILQSNTSDLIQNKYAGLGLTLASMLQVEELFQI